MHFNGLIGVVRKRRGHAWREGERSANARQAINILARHKCAAQRIIFKRLLATPIANRKHIKLISKRH